MKSRYLLASLCLALLLTTPAAVGQILWQTTTGTSAFDEGSAAFVSVPGGYLNIGQQAIQAPQQMYLSKMNEAGAVLWQRGQTFRNVRVIYPRAAVVDAMGNFYVTAITSSMPDSPVNPSSGLLVKFTASGDTIWTRRIRGEGSNNATLNAMVLSADGGIVTIGDQGVESFVIKYSPSGQIVWRRPYMFSSQYPGYLQQLAKLPIGFMVIISPDYGGVAPKYLLLGEDGQLLAEKSAPDYYPYALQPDQAGNLLSAGRLVSKISPLGEVLWSRQYQLFGKNIDVRFATETPLYGRYLLAGTRQNGVTKDIALLLVDKQGTVLRDTLLVRFGADEIPVGARFDPQGNYVVGGYVTSGPLGGSEGPLGGLDQFTIKLRSWDRLLPTTKPAARLALAYHLFPNPATSDELRVSDPDGHAFRGGYELHDVAGRLVKTGQTSPMGAMPLAGLPTGLYLVRLQDGHYWLPALRLARF